MGCTSSAPNMTTTPNATDTQLENYDDKDKNSAPKKKDAATMYAKEENGINEIKVLPTCDTLAEPIQLDSNNKSMINTSKLNLEKETHNDVVIESISPPKEEDINVIEGKLSSLEDVVEKVVELFVAENSFSTIDTERKEWAILTKESQKELNKSANDNAKEELSVFEPNKQDMEVAEGPTSPTQSNSSRATRWEALADIAAELPPSLAVDPLTGQIYALSK